MLFQNGLLTTTYLRINIDKSSLILYHNGNSYFNLTCMIKNNSLPRVTEPKDLGVIYQESFQFYKHILNTVYKACNVLRFVIRSSQKFNICTVIQLYKTNIALQFSSLVPSLYKLYSITGIYLA